MRCPDCSRPVKNEEYLKKHREIDCTVLRKNVHGQFMLGYGVGNKISKEQSC